VFDVLDELVRGLSLLNELLQLPVESVALLDDIVEPKAALNKFLDGCASVPVLLLLGYLLDALLNLVVDADTKPTHVIAVSLVHTLIG